jgi:hypothetical protein
MRVLVACEYSGVVRRAFAARGHEAWSCDILPSEDDSPHHIQGDCLTVLDEGWDLLIGHPPCTYLANSGVAWLHKQPERWVKLEDGARFFRRLWEAKVPKKALENPIMHKYAVERIMGLRPTQIVQPWMFGHMEQKATGLYLDNLKPLVPTRNVREEMKALPDNQRQRLHYLPPGPERAKLRSRTFEGIAEAMAEQWGKQA